MILMRTASVILCITHFAIPVSERPVVYCKKAALPIVVETMPAERKLSFYLDTCSFAFDPDPLLQHQDSSPPVAFQPGTPPAINEKRCVCVCV
jgi:hypothetical protein